MTTSGKSHLARALLTSAKPPRLVIDPQGSELLAQIPNQVTFRDAAHIPEGFATVRFVPHDPDDLDAYDALYAWAFDHYPRMVLCDEAGAVAPAKRYPAAANRYVFMGAKRMLGHIACHTRPREVCANFLSQAAHVFAFQLPRPEDRRYVADIAGIPQAAFDTAMDHLDDYECLYWNLRERRLHHLPPLPA